MRYKIESYIEEQFKNAPDTPQTRELEEEILSNTLDKYEDLISEGMDEESAYRSAISGIGDVDELIREYAKDSGEITPVQPTPAAVSQPEKTSYEVVAEKYTKLRWTYIAIAVALYIVSIFFPAELEELEIGRIEIESFGVAMFFILAAVATGLIVYSACFKKLTEFYGDSEKEQRTKQRAKLLAVGIGLLIACLVPVMICSDLKSELRIDWLLSVGVVMMLAMIALAVVMFICRGCIRKPIEIETYEKETLEREKAASPAAGFHKLTRIILWCLVAVTYFVVSFITGAWAVTWIIFLIGAIANVILDAIFELFDSKQ